MNWCIGQGIVAVRDHAQGCFKKGDEGTIMSLKASCCTVPVIMQVTCMKVPVYFGPTTICPKCGTRHEGHWANESYFAPLDEIEASISELVEEAFVKQPFE